MPELRMSRPKGLAFGGLRVFEIEVDGDPVAALRPIEEKVLTVAPGPHTLRARTGSISSDTLRFDAQENSDLRFEIDLVFDGWRSRLIDGPALRFSQKAGPHASLHERTEDNPLNRKVVRSIVASSSRDFVVAALLAVAVAIGVAIWSLAR